MDAAWGRVLVATGVIVALVALGALEVITARLPVDQSSTARLNSGNEQVAPWHDFLTDSSYAAAGSR